VARVDLRHGDKSNAAKYAGVLTRMALDCIRLFMKWPFGDGAKGERESAIA
jgi:hypothetical protein